MQTSLSAINQKLSMLQKHQYDHKPLNQSGMKKADDSQSIGVLTPEKTQAILNQQLAEKLQERFKEEGIELKGLRAEDFTPEKVSDRILGFVSGRVLSEQDNERQLELMEQARKGVEQGFSEARDILESLDVLNGKVKDDVDKTYDLIQRGLDRLDKQVQGIEEQEGNMEEQQAASEVQQASLSSSFSRNESTRVEITTQDGDKILIDLFKQQSAQSRRSLETSEDGSQLSVSGSLSASAGIRYEVQGELDQDEQKAIDEFLKDVARVSDSFFSGNVQKAFKQAAKLDFDSEELTRFSLNMEYEETRQVAIGTYNQYQPQASDAPQEQAAPAGIRELSEFIRELDKIFHHPFAMEKLEHPQQAAVELFNGMNQLLYSEEMKLLEKDSKALLDSLVEQLKSGNTLDNQ